MDVEKNKNRVLTGQYGQLNVERAKMVLVLGATSSGKSGIGERFLKGLFGVGYFACAPTKWLFGEWGEDLEFQSRVRKHRERRPKTWETIEIGDTPLELAQRLSNWNGPALIESTGSWVGALREIGSNDDSNKTIDSSNSALDDLKLVFEEFIKVLKLRDQITVLVGEHLGNSVHGETKLIRDYVDNVGQLNQMISEVADLALLSVAGRVMELKSITESSDEL